MKQGVIIELIVFVFCFQSFGFSQSDDFLRINNFGNVINYGYITNAKPTNNGFILQSFVNYTVSSTYPKYALIKFDSIGGLKWSKSYGYESVGHVFFTETIDSGYYIGNSADDATFGLWYFGISRIDKNGDTITGASSYSPFSMITSHEVNGLTSNKLNGDYITTNRYGHLNGVGGNFIYDGSDLIRYDMWHNKIYRLDGYYSLAKDILVSSTTNYETLIGDYNSLRKISSSGTNIWKMLYSIPVGNKILEHDSTVFLYNEGYSGLTTGSLIHQIDYNGNTLLCKRIDSVNVIEICKVDTSKLLIYGYKNLLKVLVKTDLNLNFISAVQLTDTVIVPKLSTACINPLTNSLLRFSSKNYLTTNFEMLVYNSNADSSCGKETVQIGISNYPVSDSLVNPIVPVQFSGGTATINPYIYENNFSCLSQKYNGCINVSTNDLVNLTPNTSCYPNPVNNQLYIIGNFEKGTTVSVFSVEGKKILEQPCLSKCVNMELNTINIPDGIYFLQIISDKKTLSQKIVVVH